MNPNATPPGSIHPSGTMCRDTIHLSGTVSRDSGDHELTGGFATDDNSTGTDFPSGATTGAGTPSNDTGGINTGFGDRTDRGTTAPRHAAGLSTGAVHLATQPMAVLALALLAWLAFSGGERTDPGAPVATGARQAPLAIDPNTAPVWELVALPGIGPTRAQRIIDLRSAHAGRGTDAGAGAADAFTSAPTSGSTPISRPHSTSAAASSSTSTHLLSATFRRAEDLALVHGIGPATVERLRPYLVFP